MKNGTHILLLFLMLLVIPTSSVFACGKSSEKEKTEKTSCSKEDNQTEKKSCCDNQENDDDGCGGACDNTSCHCPSSVNSTVSFKDVLLELNNNFKLLANEWTYVQNKPKAVYFSIWQPPKIS
ncbi:hypothetical protein [Cellulophaga baltica]|uniref:Uncharacterized protein n=1 Tax=Cellulophaga baltica TaxID=76594 RepID=A0A1G7LV13_9FLAO|nr:hypothetical protein [Cellulophaga baltica]SDF53216.1 hypothetical protein SAMN04487992_1223 [Cellulophaga baltica]